MDQFHEKMDNMNEKTSVENKAKSPFVLRVMAWWHGYTVEEYKKILINPDDNSSKDNAQTSEVSSKKPKKSYYDQKDSEEEYHFEDKPVASYSQDDSEDQIGDDDPEMEFDNDLGFDEDGHVVVKAVWDTDRAHVAQVFWGDGYCGPGGPDNIIGMTAELGINPKRTTMVLGAGLGGSVRTIQKEYDAKVDGYETSEQLATDGMEMSLKAGVAEHAPIIHQDLENCTSFDRSYDRVYIKETLFIINEKSQLIETIYNHLKADGIVLLTDYVVTEGADQNNALFKKWAKLEPYEPNPVLSEYLEVCLKGAGFTIRGTEDLTEFYLHLISKTREHARTVLTSLEGEDLNGVNMIKYMHNEAVLWDTRAKLLQSGDLKVVKYLCYK